mmetsp:Transcript_3072/g.8022  ORF Transcript_3072/g.8022 Transcript_3072/m.8022 type:complete len:245 (-) Transcript_3072:156-890(-)
MEWSSSDAAATSASSSDMARAPSRFAILLSCTVWKSSSPDATSITRSPFDVVAYRSWPSDDSRTKKTRSVLVVPEDEDVAGCFPADPETAPATAAAPGRVFCADFVMPTTPMKPPVSTSKSHAYPATSRATSISPLDENRTDTASALRRAFHSIFPERAHHTTTAESRDTAPTPAAIAALRDRPAGDHAMRVESGSIAGAFFPSGRTGGISQRSAGGDLRGSQMRRVPSRRRSTMSRHAGENST